MYLTHNFNNVLLLIQEDKTIDYYLNILKELIIKK